MSIWNALHSGVSGLHTHGLALGVVGDNIANVNTAGFKRARAVFGDMLSAFLPTTRGAAQLGRGVMLLGIEQLHSQGTQLQTENPLDMSIVGNGFFVVRGTHSGVTGNFFTRAGQFHLDEDGYLVNMDRLRVQGYARAPSGNLVTTRTLGDLRLGGITIPPEMTTAVDVTAALNPQDPQHVLFDPTAPDETATFTTTITIFDSLGQPHQMEIHMNRTGENALGNMEWQYHVMARSAEIVGNPPGDLVEVAGGTLEFDRQGRLASESHNPPESISFLGAEANQPIAFNFGDALNERDGTGLAGTTQFSTQSSAIVFQNQDGSPTGVLQSVIVNQEGLITGAFTNGETKTLGQLAVGSFSNPRGLDRLGGNLWAMTPESGTAAIGAANTDGRGAVFSQSLEQSNVELAEEFVDLIKTQRAYQANSRTVTTADQLLADVLQLKR